MDAEKKYEALLENIKHHQRVVVAFSGGVDSTLLLLAAKEALGKKASAITATGTFCAKEATAVAVDFCKKYEISQEIKNFSINEIPQFINNSSHRCYDCKKELFSKFLQVCHKKHAVLLEGSNLDDQADFRPGVKAIRELAVHSPLQEVGMRKEEIRFLLKSKGIAIWNRPSSACLASRISYGETITDSKLFMIEQAEAYLHQKGFQQCRVRLHQNMARIEVLPEDIDRFFDLTFREDVYQQLKKIGFTYITLDLEGFRSGSMNESIDYLQ